MKYFVVVAHILHGKNWLAYKCATHVTASLEKCDKTSKAVYHKLNMKHKTIILKSAKLLVELWYGTSNTYCIFANKDSIINEQSISL